MPIPQEWLQYAPKPRDLANGKEWNVFLSYRSVNRTWVLNLYDILKELGYKVFIDQVELAAGDDLVLRLGAALNKSQSGILIWSAAAADSAWVQREYSKMTNMSLSDPSFFFVPVKLDGTAFPGLADALVFVDFSSYPDGPNGGELLRLLHGISGKALSPEGARFANDQNELAIDMANQVDAAKRNNDPDEITRLFNENSLPWKTTASLGCKAAENLIKLGRNDEAIQLLARVKEQFPKAIRPKQMLALALARRKNDADLKEAQKILSTLYTQGERDPETVGIYARTWMDRYNKSKEPADLRQSRNYYEEAYKKAPDDYYTGINAASKSVFLDEYEKGAAIAQKILDNVGSKAVPSDYWKTATIAEAFLILKRYAEAADMYQQAVDTAPTEYGSHESTWGQAKLLMEKLKPSMEERALMTVAFAHLEKDAKQNA